MLNSKGRQISLGVIPPDFQTNWPPSGKYSEDSGDGWEEDTRRVSSTKYPGGYLFSREAFLGEKERGDFYFDRGTPRWILTGSKMSSNGFLTVALGETFLRKNNTPPSPSSQPFYSRSRFKNILLPFDDGRRSSPFRRHCILLHHVPAHPISNHALYPLTSQNQHDCG